MNWPLHFLRPWCWLALLALPPMLLALDRAGGGRAALARLADAKLLPHLISGDARRKRWMLALAAAAWVLAVAALAGPAWQRAPVPLYANGAARVIALSLSDDMLAQDVKPDRLTRARYAVRDLLDAAGDARTALVAYAGDAFVVAPLTPDRQTVLNLLEALSPDVMPESGNDAARAIAQAVNLLRQAHVDGGEIVLVTDDADDTALDAARRARAAGVRIDVLGVGTPQGAPVPLPSGGFARGANGATRVAARDDASLRELAAAGGGSYAPLRGDGSGIAAIGAPAATRGANARQASANLWRDAGAWLLIPLLPLAALAFRRGWVCVLALVLVAPFARASGWDALWATPDQRAQHALRDGDYAQAAKLARDPLLRGAAAYRQDDYAAAARHFARGRDAISQYDLGNALAKDGRYGQAIAAYDRALQNNPGLADARANRDAVRAWLRQHPPPNPSAGGEGAQGETGKSSQARHSQSSSPSQTRQASAQSGHASGNAGEQQARAGAGQDSDRQGRQADSAHGKASSQGRNAGDSGASLAEDTQQRAQAQRARAALRQELAQGRAQTGAANGSEQAQHAFALGADQAQQERGFDAQQRAMLNAVPDDPGALLRRKFMLEWQRRHGQQADDEQ